jgi:hypothetical protein
MDSGDGVRRHAARACAGIRPRCLAALLAALLPLVFAACASPAAQPTPGANGAPPASTDAAPNAPPVTCKPEPFCMSDCKRQGYPSAYCNLRCGC